MNTEPLGRAKRYEAVLEALSDLGEGLVITEAGRLIYANQAYLSMTGYSLDELLSRSNLIELAPEEFREQLTLGLPDILPGRPAPPHSLKSQLLPNAAR